ncbi:hypothetical protein SLEP1_g9609 [Rubroshorea leprosula]|uniref:Multidrug and toxic compound extrusion protein n=1 Tax=Rubroshorea leprosula TaxID=152421 RepID=A0AAV5I5G7_9ROSI|nr:hypothetical protein SLEP1_g9609 [Rubroshorea leprosula]
MSQLASSSYPCNCNPPHSNRLPNKDDPENPNTDTPLITKPTEIEPENAEVSPIVKEAISIAKIAFPMILTGLMLYLGPLVSMIFLGRQGELALAGGSLAIGFANITGYSIPSGLAMGMKSICGQAFGARVTNFLASPCKEHDVLTNFNQVALIVLYILIFRAHEKTWGGFSMECFKEWKSLLNMAIPSCISVCLELWWYEIMILLCGLLINPRATVASMGILIQTTSLIYIFPSSLSFSVSTRVENELGAEQPRWARRAAFVGLSSAILLGCSALVFAITVRHKWATVFTQDEVIVKLTSTVLPIIGLCELGNCPQTTGCSVLRGTARPKVGANINLGCFYLVGTPVAVGLAFFAGFDFQGLWMGLLAAQMSCAVTMMVVLARTDWNFEAERAKTVTGTAAAVAAVDDSKNASAEKPQQAGIPKDP